MILHPKDLETIRQELRDINIRNYKALQHASHLNACIYETLRLSPAVPSAGLRLPPKGGFIVGNTYIPENTTLVTPQYSLFRGEHYQDVEYITSTPRCCWQDLETNICAIR